MTDDRPTELTEDIVRAELSTIQARRAAVLDSEDGHDVGEPPEPGKASTANDLVGLALSGGGIRSATFSLGVISALARDGVFRRFDYLSTVSGGGYTGSMLSCLLREKGDSLTPVLKAKGAGETPALRHLRDGSNYLKTGGLTGFARLPTLLLLGFTVNALQVLPFIVLPVVLTELVHENRYVLYERAEDFWMWIQGPFAFVPTELSKIVLPLLVPLAIYLLVHLARTGNWKRRDFWEQVPSGILVLTLVALLVYPMSLAIDWAIQEPYSAVQNAMQVRLDFKAWAFVITLLVAFVTMVRASRDVATGIGKASMYLAGVVGPGVLVGAYLLLLIAQADSPFVEGCFDELLPPPVEQDGQVVYYDCTSVTQGDSAALAFAGPEATEVHSDRRLLWDLRSEFAAKGLPLALDSATVHAVWCRPDPSQPGFWHLPRAEGDRLLAASECLVSNEAVYDSTVAYRLVRRDPLTHEIWGAQLHFGPHRTEASLLPDYWLIAIALFAVVLNWLLLDINRSSPHGFYRDRLSRLYLFRLEGQEVVPQDGTRLSELNERGSPAPYHILNTTLNMRGDPTAQAKRRPYDFFFFSKHFCGGPKTGYCPTSNLEDADRQLNLGTAMAISAAAAGPNMGQTTKKSLVFIMALLNIRLGYWTPNPSYMSDSGLRAALRRRRRPGLRYLMAEALGRVRPDTPLVNLSDGGHLENLGVYELLRRRCRLIVAVDGEADPEMTFGGLATMQRLARMDLGVSIEIDTSELGLDERRLSGQHVAIGTIDYGDDGIGHLVYIKLSVTGDEETDIAKYRSDHPAFPHQTTADQYFDEVQFEAYRALGEHVGTRALGKIREKLDPIADRWAPAAR